MNRKSRAWRWQKACACFGVGLLWLGMALAQNRMLELSKTKVLMVSQVVNGVLNPVSEVSTVQADAQFNVTGLQAGVRTKREQATALIFQGMGVNLSSSQLEQKAKNMFQPQATRLSGEMLQLMRTHGASTGFFSFNQEVSVANSSKNRRLVWTMVIDVKGKATYGSPKVIDKEPSVLHVTYTHKDVDGDLPSTWAYGDAGVMKYRLMTMKGEPQSDWVSLDTGGVFDQPADSASIGVDPDAGLKCLVQWRTSCVAQQNQPTVKSLMDQTASSFAMVDYVRRIEPVYAEVVENGETFMTPQISIMVNKRVYTPLACRGRVNFANSGSYGYTLKNSIDRYLVNNQFDFQFIFNYSVKLLSPVQNYDVNKDLDIADGSQLVNSLIDPKNPGGALLDKKSIDYVYFADLSSNPRKALKLQDNIDPSRLTNVSVKPVYFVISKPNNQSPNRQIEETFTIQDVNSLKEMYFTGSYVTWGAEVNGYNLGDGYTLNFLPYLKNGLNTIKLYSYWPIYINNVFYRWWKFPDIIISDCL